MKNMLKVLGITVLVAVIGFTMVGCSKSSGATATAPVPSSGAGGGIGRGFIVNGRPAGPWQARVFPAGMNVTIDAAYSGDDCEAAGSVGDPLLIIKDGLPTTHWRGSGSREVVLISPSGEDYYRTTVNFTNGSAELAFSDFTALTE